MCGICGIVDSKTGSGDRERIVKSMMSQLAHRGPDGQGICSGEGFTFGHRRLAVIEISEKAAQPMRTTDGRGVLSFNGEIYNFLELRQNLTRSGATFRGFSDTEVLLSLLEREGKNSLLDLNGMFAFAYIDARSGEWIFARDHFGIKPFYYARLPNGGIAFASEVKALLVHPDIKAEPDWESIEQYLTFQFTLGEGTLFTGVERLLPGHLLEGVRDRISEPVLYWEASYHVDNYHTESYFRDRLLNLLEDSARLQIRSDVPIGAYVSGGLDSSAVATMAADHLGEGLKVFTGKFTESPAYDESAYAKEVAASAGAEYHEVTLHATDFADRLPELIRMMDEPAAGPGLFPQHMVSRAASDHVKVVLGGQGGDEIFGGYARYLVGYLEQALKGAIFETQEEGRHVVTLQSILPNLPLIQAYVPLLRGFWQSGLFEEMDARYFRLIDRSPDIKRLLHEDCREGFDEERVYESFRAIFNNPDTKSYFNKMTHFDQQTLLPALLQVEDRVSMSVSLESRVPLLDRRIVELVTAMPPNMKFAGGNTKHIFRKAIENVIPASVLQRKDKMGFPVPLREWMSGGPVRDFVSDVMSSRVSRERGLFDPTAINLTLNAEVAAGRQLWGALCLELWFQTFIDG